MKIFATIKIGYSSGAYGCTGEYFNTIIIADNGMENILYHGMYGVEDRIGAVLKEQGFEQRYLRSVFGRMKQGEVRGKFLSEHEAIEELRQRAR